MPFRQQSARLFLIATVAAAACSQPAQPAGDTAAATPAAAPAPAPLPTGPRLFVTNEVGGDMTVVNEESRTIMPAGPATTEFHISKPDGWPSGDYQVEVFLDDMSVGVKNFKVS